MKILWVLFLFLLLIYQNVHHINYQPYGWDAVGSLPIHIPCLGTFPLYDFIIGSMAFILSRFRLIFSFSYRPILFFSKIFMIAAQTFFEFFLRYAIPSDR